MEKDLNHYCDEWRVNYFINESVLYVSGFLIVYLNQKVVELFGWLTKYEKRDSVNQEVQSKFIKMTVV